ncbi:MAG: hypothetical protein WCI26_11505 [Acidimicrobiales bacterium]
MTGVRSNRVRPRTKVAALLLAIVIGDSQEPATYWGTGQRRSG